MCVGHRGPIVQKTKYLHRDETLHEGGRTFTTTKNVENIELIHNYSRDIIELKRTSEVE